MPFTVFGSGSPAASSTVGATSITWWNCERISPLALMPVRPVQHHAVARAAEVAGDLLGPLERRVARPGPADGEVREGRGAAPVVDVAHHLVGLADDAVERHHLVVGAFRSAFGAGAVVADDVEEERVVELADRFELRRPAGRLRGRCARRSRRRSPSGARRAASGRRSCRPRPGFPWAAA